MKILQVIDRVEVGGAERVFLDLTSLLLDKGFRVDTLCISAQGKQYDTIDTRANSMFLNRKSKYSILTMWKCAAICSKYDIVHVHMRFTYAYIRLAQLVSFRKFKIVFHDHFGDIEKDKSIPWSLKGIFCPHYYIGVSNTLYTWSKDFLRINNTNTWLLRNTIIPHNVSNNNDVKYGERKWLVVSNLRETKNIEFAVDLALKMNRKLTIVGQVLNNEYSIRLKAFIEQHLTLTLLENEQNVQSLMGAYSLALHTAKSESGPLVLMEYLAQGLPFVAYETGEVANILKDILPQCFLKSFDESDWINKIEHIEQNPPSATYLKSLFETYFGPEKYINQCLAIYQQVVNS